MKYSMDRIYGPQRQKTYFRTHYENMPIQTYWKFYNQTNKQKTKKDQIKNSDIFHISALNNIDCSTR